MRPSWDEIWMNVALEIARRSTDPRLKVGCVVVADDNTQLLALGYNGNYAGGPEEPESNEPGQTGFLHAEENCCIKLDYNNSKHKKMYITHSPCRMCAKRLVNAKINEVIYKDEYRDISGLDILRASGIIVRPYLVQKGICADESPQST